MNFGKREQRKETALGGEDEKSGEDNLRHINGKGVGWDFCGLCKRSKVCFLLDMYDKRILPHCI